MAKKDRPLLAITGGYGRVARVLSGLQNDYSIRLIDRTFEASPLETDDVRVGDLRDETFIRKALRGADAVLHLAANASPSSPWPAAADNMLLTHNVLEAAAVSKVEHLVIASSIHASGGDYRSGHLAVTTSGQPRPCCWYGVSKVATEELARLHADTTGAKVACLRFGLTGWPLTAREYADSWLGNEDALSIVRYSLASAAPFGVYHAVSRYAAQFWSTKNATDVLGWEPVQELPVQLESLPPADTAPCRMFELAGPT